MEPALAVHGGAGTIPAALLDPATADAYHAALRRALLAGWQILGAGGRSLDAVTQAIIVLEDDALFNAARGSVFNADGALEMDAAIMSGRERDAGAVAGICGPRNPILGARAVMEHSSAVLMTGPGAEAFLRAQGFVFMPRDYFYSQRRMDALHRERERRMAGGTDLGSDADRHGTVGAVARDIFGDLAGGTSTGGITGKPPGRVGDTPVFGAGTYADNNTCAVSATGTGEVFIRFMAAAEIAGRMRHGKQSLRQAAYDVVAELEVRGGDGGLIAVAQTGPPVLPFNSAGMYRGYIGPDGIAHTAIHREGYRSLPIAS